MLKKVFGGKKPAAMSDDEQQQEQQQGHEKTLETEAKHRGVGGNEDFKKITGVIVGAGARGYGYSLYALDHPERVQFIGVADPKQYRRTLAQKAHAIPDANVFKDWRDLAEKGKIADFVIIATQDRDHWEPAVAFANLGYHILLEKPMAVEEQHCRDIAAACEANNVMLAVCHVLRYAPHNRLIKALLSEGKIGRLVNVQHTEPIGYFHYAHSYVRGNWRNEEQSTFALMAKSCHDVDLIRWWVSKPCEAVSSFGSLSEFHGDRKPDGAAERCLDCKYQDDCTYSAKTIYLRNRWFASHIVDSELTEASIEESLKTTQYGKCVWQSDNDVVDNQVVNFQFEDGVTASFSMIAFTEKLCERETTFYGTEGQIRCYGEHQVEVFTFKDRKKEKIPVPFENHGRLGGHGGADFYLMDAFVTAVSTNNPDLILTNPRDALESHLLVFQAERARCEGRVVRPAMEEESKN